MCSNQESATEIVKHPQNAERYPQWLTILIFLPCLLFTTFYWVLGALGLSVVCLVTRPFLNEDEHRSLGQACLAKTLGAFIDVLEIVGVMHVDDRALNPLREMEGPLIITSNHPAMWDALLIIRRVGSVSCIMKASLLSNPILRIGAKFAGFLPNAPNLKMIHGALDSLSAKERLLLFPEGTRSRPANGAVNPFRSGMAVIAQRSMVPVIPVYIATDSPYLGKGWPIWRIPQFPIRIKIKVGELQRVAPEEKSRAFSHRLEQYYRELIEANNSETNKIDT